MLGYCSRVQNTSGHRLILLELLISYILLLGMLEMSKWYVLIRYRSVFGSNKRTETLCHCSHYTDSVIWYVSAQL